ncbi:MAG: hypothetical protein R3F62_30675 [Planctomycetota bacterium]
MTVDLNAITIAAPCTADWDAMQGDERVRFCGQCELNVYNLSAMSEGEAQTLVQETEGRLCVRLYKRRDGTLITQDCPVGLRAILRRRLSWLAGLAASLLATVGGVLLGARGQSSPPSHPPVIAMGAPRPLPVVEPVVEPVIEVEPEMMMGEIMVPEPTPEEDTPKVCGQEEPRDVIMGRVRAPE